MKILFASSNKGKSAEIKEVAQSFPEISIVFPEEVGPGAPEVEESAADYRGNAELKARAYQAWGGVPALADDTGLEVKALNGLPGVRSARYAGEPSNPKKNIAKLLEELRGCADRRARFVCVLVAILQDLTIVTSEAALEGSIIEGTRGSGGFGYDSIFVPAGFTKTLAELKGEGSSVETHRIAAARKLFSDIAMRLAHQA